MIFKEGIVNKRMPVQWRVAIKELRKEGVQVFWGGADCRQCIWARIEEQLSGQTNVSIVYVHDANLDAWKQPSSAGELYLMFDIAFPGMEDNSYREAKQHLGEMLFEGFLNVGVSATWSGDPDFGVLVTGCYPHYGRRQKRRGTNA